MKILVLNGPNLNMLGTRNPEIYGTKTLEDINAELFTRAAELNIDVVFKQSNSEGALIDALQAANTTCDGVVFNPGAYAHYSYALRDAIEAIQIPVAEVHISDTLDREDFRKIDVVGEVCAKQIIGEGTDGYRIALEALCG